MICAFDFVENVFFISVCFFYFFFFILSKVVTDYTVITGQSFRFCFKSEMDVWSGKQSFMPANTAVVFDF